MKGRLAVGCLVVAMALAAPEAMACLPPAPFLPAPAPPAGTSSIDALSLSRAYHMANEALRDAETLAQRQRYQTGLFDRASRVFLARVDRTEIVADPPAALKSMEGTQRVVLMPVRWLKGASRGAEISLAYTGLSSCGPMPSFDAMAGSVGDVFVIYLSADAPEQKNVLDAIAVKNLLDPGILGILANKEPLPAPQQ